MEHLVYALYGTHGSGKTSTAKAVVKEIDIEYVAADAISVRGIFFGKNSFLEKMLLSNFDNILKTYDAYKSVIHVFFLSSTEGKNKILKRIKKRKRENVEEELHYFDFIEREMRELKTKLKQLDYLVEEIQADKDTKERKKDFIKIVKKYSFR